MPFNPNHLVNVIQKNKDKKIIATKIIETNPKILPIVPKLVADSTTAANISENSRLKINRSMLENIHNKIKSVIQNNKNIIKLFPDIELAIQVLVSSILSPKKMTDTQLNYKLDKLFPIDSILTSNILEAIKDYVNTEYEIEDKLPEILREALFNSGAYAMVVIPESSVDDLINIDITTNYSAEEFKQKADNLIYKVTRPINIISSIAVETYKHQNKNVSTFINSLTSAEYLKITDNVDIVKFAKIKEKITKSIISGSLKRNVAIAQESLDKLNYLDIFRQRSVSSSNKELEFIKTKSESKRKSLGKPLVIKIPTSSIIPITTPGNETEHIGYFILLDENGKPLNIEISEANNSNTYTNIDVSNVGGNMSPVQQAYKNLVYDNTSDIDINQLFGVYKEVIERQIYSSIKNSLYGSNTEIANRNDIYFTMFTRALSGQKTNLLFLPKELVVYFTFYYNEIGVGKSLLENLSILTSLRAILLFSKVMAYAKQSIDVTKVNISLDPNDMDPEKTIEQVQDSVLKLRQNFFPLGINNPMDLVSWIQRAGLQFSYENNPNLPNIKIDFENANLSHTVPSSEIDEELRKQTIISLGLSPEIIDNGFSPEFATTVVNNNILLSKRIAVYQKKLTKQISELLAIIIYNDEDLRDNLKKILIDNNEGINKILDETEKKEIVTNKEQFIEKFIDKIGESIYVDLPKPDNTNITTLSAEYDIYKENLDKVIDSVISSEIFADSISGDLSEHIDTIRVIYKHYLLRNWMAENNFYPEVLELSQTNDSDIKNLLDSVSNHLIQTNRNSAKLMSILQDFRKAINKDMEKIKGEPGDSGGYDDSSDSNEDTSDNSDEAFGISDDYVDLEI
jgi:hypothetical protein